MAAGVHELDKIVALFGSVTTASLSMIIPCVIDLLIKYPDLNVWVVVKNTFIIGFGTVGSVLGTALSIKDLVNL